MAKIQIKSEKLTQSIAIANAKHCNRQRKALHLPTQMFVGKGAFI